MARDVRPGPKTVLFGGRAFHLMPVYAGGNAPIGWQVYEYVDYASAARIAAVDELHGEQLGGEIAHEAFRNWYWEVRRAKPCPDPVEPQPKEPREL